mmetsp:Transcript_31450/g.65744  ORF Transcript_31450/g.65744 Transcript_31450/m.65744 type:complete len:234 (+) Transcript_31450:737-1438(+)
MVLFPFENLFCHGRTLGPTADVCHEEFQTGREIDGRDGAVPSSIDDIDELLGYGFCQGGGTSLLVEPVQECSDQSSRKSGVDVRSVNGGRNVKTASDFALGVAMANLGEVVCDFQAFLVFSIVFHSIGRRHSLVGISILESGWRQCHILLQRLLAIHRLRQGNNTKERQQRPDQTGDQGRRTAQSRFVYRDAARIRFLRTGQEGFEQFHILGSQFPSPLVEMMDLRVKVVVGS